MNRLIALAFAGATTLGASGAAQAAHLDWSIGINLPPVATVVSDGPMYAPGFVPAPVYYAPRPVVVAPFRGYRHPHRWAPRPVFVAPHHDRRHHDRGHGRR